jgi:hypothetical protein
MNVRRKIGSRGRAGLSLMELMVLVAVMALVAMILLPYLARSKAHPNRIRIKCVDNLKNVGLAFRIFATDNNDLFPGQVMASNGWHKVDVANVYQWLSNELSTPKILYCPNDTQRQEAARFTSLAPKNISYFASLSASETNPVMFLAGDRNLMTNGKAVGPGVFALTTNSGVGWTKEIHVEQGNITMADGSVQQMSSARLRQAVGAQEVGTNWLAIP